MTAPATADAIRARLEAAFDPEWMLTTTELLDALVPVVQAMLAERDAEAREAGQRAAMEAAVRVVLAHSYAMGARDEIPSAWLNGPGVVIRDIQQIAPPAPRPTPEPSA